MNQHSPTQPPLISATAPDWRREHKRFFEWAPGKSLLASIRLWQKHSHSRMPWAWGIRKLAVAKHRFWSVVTGADIPVNCQIGGGLLIPHPNGIVIHPGAVIGVNCLILQQVTIGAAHGRDVPHVFGHVDIGAGAKLLGGIRVGPHARIGANAVVTKDVPNGATAVGIPARIIQAS